MQHLGTVDRQQGRPHRDDQGTRHCRDYCRGNRHPLVLYRVGERTAGNLARHAGDRADAERRADSSLAPADAGQINREKGAKTGLKIGDKEIQPIEAIKAARHYPELRSHCIGVVTLNNHSEKQS